MASTPLRRAASPRQPAGWGRKVRGMMHLVRHPLSAVLLVLVILFFIFFVLSPLLHLIFALVVLFAIVWVVSALMSVHREHRTRVAKR